ncbi:MAG: hypothetical protein WCG85_06555 [Polyangia bacterium]|jgi:hypothetical protein
MRNLASLVPLKNIFLLWTESSDQSRLKRILSTWSEAEDAIRAMAKVAPEHGYDKTCFRVEWAHGESYEVRLDIARVVVEVPHPLAGNVRRALEFTSGRWRPANMTDEQQQSFLAENERLRPGGAAWAAKLLDGYELGGAP